MTSEPTSKEARSVEHKAVLLQKTIANCVAVLRLTKGQKALADMREYRALAGKSELILKVASMGVSRAGRKNAFPPQDLGEGEEE